MGIINILMTFKVIRPGKIFRKKGVNTAGKRTPKLRGQEEEPTKTLKITISDVGGTQETVEGK